MINHVLNHLRLKADEVLLALAHLAVDDLVKGNLALDIARRLGDLLVRQAALLHLAGAQAKHQTGVVEHVGLAGIVQVDADLLGDADLVGGKAAGIVDRLKWYRSGPEQPTRPRQSQPRNAGTG